MISASLHHVQIPLHRPFGHVIATRQHAEAIVLVLDSAGVGECVPRPYVTGETFDSVWDAIRRVDLDALVSAVDPTSQAALVRSAERLALPERLGGLAAGCAVELAVLDLACKRAGWRFVDLALAMGLPADLVSAVPLPEVISVPLDLRSEPRDLAHLIGSKLGNLKIKVGGDLATDVARVAACRELFGSTVSISVDANMAWSVDEAVAAARALRPFAIGWFEEPLQPAMRPRYRELRERAEIAVMLDESACGFAQAAQAIDSGSCDLINIRLSKCGGYLASLRLAELAHRRGIRFQHGCQVGQLGILNAAGRQLTSCVRGIVACEGGPGLANLTDFPTDRKLALDWDLGHLVGTAGPGLGTSADPDKLRRHSIRSAAWTGARWEVSS
jgi:L-Ala-D/L-Glu epimerase